MTTTTEAFLPCDTNVIVAQTGRMTVLAVSGGRVTHRETGITLPVRYGYAVTVDYAAGDTYTVRRTFTRGARTWIKREWTEVYAEDLSQTCYVASCYLDV